MPQLDPTFFVSQLFWLCLSFALLFVLMQFWALPGVTKVIQNRHKIIDADLKQAANQQQEVEKINKICAENMTKARATASDMLKKTIDEMKQYNQDRENELAATLQNHLKNAENKLLKSKQEALQDIENAAAELSHDIITKLANTSVDHQILRTEIKQAIGS
jgi:F-type H+-transporting ATPase subunit b